MAGALLFDIGEVLIGLDLDGVYEAASEVSPYSPAQLRDKLAALDLARPYELGRITSQEFFERCRLGLELDVDYAGFREIWGRMLKDEPLVDPDWLTGLAEKHRLVTLSNTNDLHIDWLRSTQRILEPFHAMTLSYQVGAMKPERRIYEAAVEAAGCAPEECFFVDDRPENIEGALAFGIRAELYESPARLRERIEAL